MGAETSTDDLEGDITSTYRSESLDDVALHLKSIGNAAMQYNIESLLPQFHGAVQQKPPAYSAIKIDGERAYDLARAGEDVDIAARDGSD